MIFPDAVFYFRHILGDHEELDADGEVIVPSEYTDDRLAVLLAIGIKQVQSALRIPMQHRIEVNIKGDPFHVDPNFDIHDDFLELVILRSLCALQKRNIDLQFGTEKLTAALGPAKLQTGEATWKGIPQWVWEQTSPCAEYDLKLKNLMTFDPRKVHAVYAVLANRGAGGSRSGRSQFDNVNSRAFDMID